MSHAFNRFYEGRRFVKLQLEWKVRNAMGDCVLHMAVNTEDALEVRRPASKDGSIISEEFQSIEAV